MSGLNGGREPHRIELGKNTQTEALWQTLDPQVIGSGSTANEVYERLGGRGLRALFGDVAPSVLRTLQAAEVALDGPDAPGFFVIDDTGVDNVEPEVAQLRSIAIGSIYGNPTRTDRRLQQVAWPVQWKPGPSEGPRTISLTRTKGGFHTDTQYYPKPEERFGLFCVAADVPGKGTNRLIRAADVLALLRQEDPAVLDALQQPFPFRIPNEYTTHDDPNTPEITRAPIVTPKGHIRYRQDTIDRGIAATPGEVTDAQREALQVLQGCLGSVAVTEYHLQAGQGILINNETILHDRTAFEDPRRLLYRVRMAKLAA